MRCALRASTSTSRAASARPAASAPAGSRRSSRRSRTATGPSDLDLLLDVCDRVNGKCLCPLGDSDALVVASCLDRFRDEFQAHIDQGAAPSPTRPFTTCSRPSCRSSAASIASCTSFLHERGLVTVTVDGRAVEVAKGTGLVETAAAGGIEIPVFCYEPRLGPPVGACRMCLVEVEGVPKLQAGCTLTAQDG